MHIVARQHKSTRASLRPTNTVFRLNTVVIHSSGVCVIGILASKTDHEPRMDASVLCLLSIISSSFIQQQQRNSKQKLKGCALVTHPKSFIVKVQASGAGLFFHVSMCEGLVINNFSPVGRSYNYMTFKECYATAYFISSLQKSEFQTVLFSIFFIEVIVPVAHLWLHAPAVRNKL